MAKISVEKTEPGQIVQEDVLNENGQLLIKKGLALTERHIHLLKTWGIPLVNIEGADGPTQSEPTLTLSPEAISKAEEFHFPRFRHLPQDDKIISQVIRHCIQRSARRWQVQGIL